MTQPQSDFSVDFPITDIAALPEILPPKFDIVFKILFGGDDDKRPIAALLRAIFKSNAAEYAHAYATHHYKNAGKPLAETEKAAADAALADISDFHEIEILNPFQFGDAAGDKMNVLDVKLHTGSGRVINIEIQLAQRADLANRLDFYGSRMLAEGLKEGENYSELNQVINICITDFVFVKCDNVCYHRFSMNDIVHNVHLSNIRETHIIELPKLSTLPANDDLRNWLQFFNAKTKEDIVMLATTHPELQPVSQKLFHVSADRRAHELYEARLKYSLDRSSDLAYAKQEGFALGEQRGLLLGEQKGLLLGEQKGLLLGKQEGLLLGKQEGLLLGERNRALKIAHNLRTAKFPLSQIAEMTGLSISELSAEFASCN